LIKSIMVVEQRRYGAAAAEAVARTRRAAAIEARAAAGEGLKTVWDQWSKTADLARQCQQAPADGGRTELVALPQRIAAALELQTQRLADAYLRWHAAVVDERTAGLDATGAATRLAEVDSRRVVHLEHREMVLAESEVAQLRGTFRTSRRVLVLGALATAAGATLYALALPSEHDDDPPSRAVMTFTPDVPAPAKGDDVTINITGAAGELAECAGVDLEGRLVGDAGDVTRVVVTDSAVEPCVGLWVLPAGSWVNVAGATLPTSDAAPTTTEAPAED
jgi:hypothetical protein